MSRYTGPSWKIARRLNYSISETGKELIKRPFPPGQHGKRRTKLSEYAQQLQEKQKVRFTYGVGEKQFKKTFIEAGKTQGKHGVNFLILLESRLDNVVYRLGYAKTRRQARQLVNHSHFMVDGKKVNIPSYRLVPGQKISLREKSKGLVIIKDSLEAVISRPDYISFEADKLSGVFARKPERNEFLKDINEQLIVEFYSR